jgi:hypothetical protein
LREETGAASDLGYFLGKHFLRLGKRIAGADVNIVAVVQDEESADQYRALDPE